jgi:hypothetical protein
MFGLTTVKNTRKALEELRYDLTKEPPSIYRYAVTLVNGDQKEVVAEYNAYGRGYIRFSLGEIEVAIFREELVSCIENKGEVK